MPITLNNLTPIEEMPLAISSIPLSKGGMHHLTKACGEEKAKPEFCILRNLESINVKI